MTIDLLFYRTTHSSIHAGLSNSRVASLPSTAAPHPITSHVSSKTPQPPIYQRSCRTLLSLLCTFNFAHCTGLATLSLICRRHPRRQTGIFVATAFYSALFSSLSTPLRQFPSIVVVVPPLQRQTGVFAVVKPNTLLSFTHYSSLSFPLAQQFSLNCCRATPRRGNYTCLLRKISLFPQLSSPLRNKKANPSPDSLLYLSFAFYLSLGTISPAPEQAAAPPPDSAPALSPSLSDPSMDQSAWQHPAAPGLAPRSTAIPSRTLPPPATTRRS
jgi:hypothetical protein